MLFFFQPNSTQPWAFSSWRTRLTFQEWRLNQRTIAALSLLDVETCSLYQSSAAPKWPKKKNSISAAVLFTSEKNSVLYLGLKCGATTHCGKHKRADNMWFKIASGSFPKLELGLLGSSQMIFLPRACVVPAPGWSVAYQQTFTLTVNIFVPSPSND